jgi:hypothetical protein
MAIKVWGREVTSRDGDCSHDSTAMMPPASFPQTTKGQTKLNGGPFGHVEGPYPSLMEILPSISNGPALTDRNPSLDIEEIRDLESSKLD